MEGGGKGGKGKSAKGGGNKGGVTTLSDLHRHVESDSDSDGPQEYYAGGEKSGMMVQDPSSRGRRDMDSIFARARESVDREGLMGAPAESGRGRRDIDSIFDRARESGAREGFMGAPVESGRGSFTGSRRTLAGAEGQAEAQDDADTAPAPVFHTITFWRNGFTVDNGPLRRFDDPANAPFLDSINKTECPRELEPAARDTPVHVNLVRREEEWQAPKEAKQVVAFQGTARTLRGTATPPAAPESAPVPPRDAGNEPFQGLVVDETKPSTSVQLRLSDGTRMVARFNHHHTVADVRGFIDASRRGGSGSSYQLQTMGFPPKQLTDPLQTIEQAGLINAVVIQKAG